MTNLKYVQFPNKVDETPINHLDKTMLGAQNINDIKDAINTNADILLEVKSSIPDIADWAKSAHKPIYSWNEIQEKPDIEQHIANSIVNKADKSELASFVHKIPFNYVSNCILYSFSDEQLKDAMISSITIITDEGEVLLPYGNENGISKIYRKSNNFYFQLGNNVESFTNGFIYLSQLVLTNGSIGSEFSVNVNSHVEENTTIFYGTVMPIDETYVSITMINSTMLNDSSNNVYNIEPGAIQNPITLNNCPIGSYIFVLIPSDSLLVAYKDDGFGNSIDFDKNIGLENSGSTGTLVTIDNKQYKVYGELNINDNSTNIIYIK